MAQTYSQGSGTRILWVIAVDGPVTTREIADTLDINATTVRTAVKRLWQSELVLRRKRPVDNGGRNPYEYKLRESYD